jgi:Fe-S-cluster containining protein
VRSDRRLLQVVDQALAEAARLAAREEGSWLACRPGCTECCHGPFPINRLDVLRLRAGLAELAERDPQRAGALAERAHAQLPLLRQSFPGDPRNGVLADDDADSAETFFSDLAALPCPVLDPETGRCELYAHRPLTCRTYGPPVRIGEAALPPCRLCFQGAAPETIEACRVEPDPNGLEDRILDRLGDEETLIAFAVASADS